MRRKECFTYMSQCTFLPSTLFSYKIVGNTEKISLYSTTGTYIILSYYSLNHTERRILVLTTNSLEVIALISRYAPAYLSFSIVFQLRDRRKVPFRYKKERQFLFKVELSINAAILHNKVKI